MMDDAGFSIGEAPDDPPEGEGKAKRPRRRDVIAGLLSDVILRRSPEGLAHASVPRADGGREHMRCESKTFREWLTLAYLQATGAGISGTALGEAVNLAVARALASGEVAEFSRRVARGKDGAIWWDMGGGDPAGERRAVRIGPEGWRVVQPREVEPAFLRGPDGLPLAEPEGGESTAATLAELINVAPGDFPLLWGYLMASLRPFSEGGAAYPILFLHGEQGSGKSSAARIIQSLIDPSTLSGRALPREERDLWVTASNRHLLAFDNVSSIGDAYSDAFCRIATGGGFAGRTLHTDADETILTATRPQLFNGIPELIGRPDFAERCLAIECKTIKGRATDAEIGERFRRLRPGLLGVICDGLSAGLRNLSRTKLENPPRMADAALWAEACAEGLGIEPGEIARGWRTNRRQAEAEQLANDDVAGAVIRLLDDRKGEWIGTPSELADELRAKVSDTVARSLAWPRSPAALSNRLRRLGPALRRVKDITFASRKMGADGTRTITLSRGAGAAADA